MPSYKEEKEAFVSDTSGSSVFHILKISSITIVSVPDALRSIVGLPSNTKTPESTLRVA